MSKDFITFKDFCEMIGVPYNERPKLTLEEIQKMTPEELKKFYSQLGWSKTNDSEDEDLSKLFKELEFDKDGNLLFRF